MKTESTRPGTAGAVSETGKRLFPRERRREDWSGGLDKRQLLAALTRLKKGHFDVLLPEDRVGLDGKIADTFNEVVELHKAMSRELERLSHVVGKRGRLSERASLFGVGGSWAASMQSVNALIGDLVHPISETARVIGAVAKGDLSQTMALESDGRPLEGEFLSTARTVNTMVDQLSSFASEVTRVAREVGTEGKLGGQALVVGVSGTWKDLTDSVNLMASNLTAQVRNIAAVTTAVANGDLTKKITVDVQGEILELKDTVNTMVDQLRSFASEVTRVAGEVGTEGKLGGQAIVPGVAGTWKDLTDNVNSMASNLTAQVRNIADVTKAVANGDLSKKITVDVKGEILELKDTINTMVDQLRSFASEVTRVAREVGTEGKLGGQATVADVAGTWKDLTDNVNSMAGNLTAQVRNIAGVTTAVARGDLSKKITVDVQGEIRELKDTINTMVDQLSSFASEVTRVAREVGTEGKLGGQAEVAGVSGTWKDLTDNVNSMAGNLTSQVRGIARVVTAVANGNLKRKLTVEAKGEIAALADTINGMIDTLATFAEQVTSVAREVGVEGKLGGQASVPGAAGTWRDLTDNVNQLAANLTTQVRAIAEVATAVTKGDLTRSIAVQASGEVAALKDNINEMIRNLKDTTQENSEQDWLKTNLAKFSRMLQGQRDLLTVARLILSELVPVVSAQQAVFYTLDDSGEEPKLTLLASYATRPRAAQKAVRLGEGLVGQCALEKRKILLTQVPKKYLSISSGLGESAAASIIVLPVLFEGSVKAVLELASFERFSSTHQALLDQLTESIGIVLNTIEANTLTEDLLKQSQSLAAELQNQQEELQQTNQKLEEKAALLVEQNAEVERKNMEVEQARVALEEKAEQLALTSRYKSEFLANMSHELRTPLNSLLILSDQLSKNPEGNLTSRQTEFAKTIHASGKELLTLINDILDLSKIESGTVVVDVGELRLPEFLDYVERNFRHVAEAKGVGFQIEVGRDVPRAIVTDSTRFQQVIKNLLSNAFKFTERGLVTLRVETARKGWSGQADTLNRARSVLAISVADTGIGISPEKQQIIFEAFQQADGSTSRKYGGTGLGLAISREIARLLGGEIRLSSEAGVGSTFTLFLPQVYVAQKTIRAAAAPASDSVPALAPPVEAVAAPVSAESFDTGEVADDRADLGPEERVLLIIDNDEAFARFLLEMAHENGFKAIVATQGADGIALAQTHRIDAITLDIRLPVIDGWRVFDRLKNDLDTRHIPVYLITTEEDAARGLSRGAVGALVKPIREKETLCGVFAALRGVLDRRQKDLLLIADGDGEAAIIADSLAQPAVRVRSVPSRAEALEALAQGRFDAVVAEVLPLRGETDGWEEIVRVSGSRQVPVLLFTPRELSAAEDERLQRYSRLATVKRVRSADRLADQIALFLHVPVAQLSEVSRQRLARLYSNSVLAGKKVLIVDDDIRNIFAIASVLERQEMVVFPAETGQEAVEKLLVSDGVDIVLMDIMMPGMDGFDTMQEIRRIDRLRSLPIIAVTAKAMKGDREKTLQAGAWDYLAKPVDTDHMLSVLRSWLHR